MFTVAATLLIIALKGHTHPPHTKPRGSRDPSTEAHMGGVRAISYFLIHYVFSTVALNLFLSVFDANSSWTILCKIIMAAYPAGHSVLLISGNPRLRRAWKRFQYRVHIFTSYQGRRCGWNPPSTRGPAPNSSAFSSPGPLFLTHLFLPNPALTLNRLINVKLNF